MKAPAVTRAGSFSYDGETGDIHLAGWEFDYMHQVYEGDAEAARVSILAAIDHIRSEASMVLPNEVDASKFWVRTSKDRPSPPQQDEGKA